MTDVVRSRAFYRDLLRAVGIDESMSLGVSVGFGVGRPGAFWIYPTHGRSMSDDDGCGISPAIGEAPPRLHVAFRAQTRGQVRAFVDRAEQLGAEIVYRPRVFPEYHAAYYAAFVRDPDGHNVEVVCEAPD